MQHRVCDLEEACDVCADDKISGLSGLDGGVVSGFVNAAHNVVQPLVHFLERPAQAHAVLGHFERGGRNAAGVRRLGRADGDARRLQHGNGLWVDTISDGGDNGGLPENYPFERTTSNGEGEYGKSNPDATGRADLATMQKVRQELWDMGSSESSKLTYDDIKAMLGGEDGIPHTGMDEKSWNSEKHAYGCFMSMPSSSRSSVALPCQVGSSSLTSAATFSSSVRGDS